MPTIKVSDEVKLKLTKIGGQLMARDGRKRTYEDVILELIRLWEKAEGVEERE